MFRAAPSPVSAYGRGKVSLLNGVVMPTQVPPRVGGRMGGGAQEVNNVVEHKGADKDTRNNSKDIKNIKRKGF